MNLHLYLTIDVFQNRLSSEGHRPSMLTTSPPAQNVTSTSNDIDARLKREVISAEENRTRSELLGKATNHNQKKRGGLETDAELRRRLGLSDIPKTKVDSNGDIANQLAKDEKLRDDIADDVLSLLETFRENTLNVQRSLKNDASRIEIADDLISKNRENVQKEIARVDTLYRQTALSCYANCALVSTVLAIWIAVYIVMKITPSPRPR